MIRVPEAPFFWHVPQAIFSPTLISSKLARPNARAAAKVTQNTRRNFLLRRYRKYYFPNTVSSDFSRPNVPAVFQGDRIPVALFYSLPQYVSYSDSKYFVLPKVTGMPGAICIAATCVPISFMSSAVSSPTSVQLRRQNARDYFYCHNIFPTPVWSNLSSSSQTLVQLPRSQNVRGLFFAAASFFFFFCAQFNFM